MCTKLHLFCVNLCFRRRGGNVVCISLAKGPMCMCLLTLIDWRLQVSGRRSDCGDARHVCPPTFRFSFCGNFSGCKASRAVCILFLSWGPTAEGSQGLTGGQQLLFGLPIWVIQICGEKCPEMHLFFRRHCLFGMNRECFVDLVMEHVWFLTSKDRAMSTSI